MKDRVKAKRIARYYDQCRLPMWANVLGIVLLVFGLVAAGITAIFHDKYSSIFGAWESALTNVWFIAFIALVGVGALISLGYPLLTLIGAWIWTLFAKPEPDVAEEQPERVIINEARLRTIFNSDFMTSWSAEPGKMYVDKVVEDLQFVRDNYKQGAKDKVHFADKHIIEIADILHKNKYFRKVTNSFTEWCCTMFDCLSIGLPERDNIKKYQEYSDQVKKRFYYLL